MTNYVVVLLDEDVVEDGLYMVQQYTITCEGELTYDRLLEELHFINGIDMTEHNRPRAIWLCDNYFDTELWATVLRCKYGEYDKSKAINSVAFTHLCAAYIQMYGNTSYVEYIKAMIMGA